MLFRGGGGGGGTNTGGDLARTATAVESIASAVSGTDATLSAEGEAAIAAGAAASATEANLHSSLPQSTVDFSGGLSSVSVALFGSGTCPASTYMFDWNGQPISFPYDTICTFAGYVGVIVAMAGALLGFKVAMS